MRQNLDKWCIWIKSELFLFLDLFFFETGSQTEAQADPELTFNCPALTSQMLRTIDMCLCPFGILKNKVISKFTDLFFY